MGLTATSPYIVICQLPGKRIETPGLICGESTSVGSPSSLRAAADTATPGPILISLTNTISDFNIYCKGGSSMSKPLILSVLQDEELLVATVQYAAANTKEFMDYLEENYPELYEKYTSQVS